MTATSGRATTSEGRQAMLQDARHFFARNGLYRSRDQQLLGGVCAGLGRRVKLQPWPARLLFLLMLMLLPGSQLIVYPVLWLLLPLEQVPAAGDKLSWAEAGRAAAPPVPSDLPGSRTR